jgi:sugar transferase (PEP-CTERM system associated)
VKIFSRNISRLRVLLFSFEFVLITGTLYAISFLRFLVHEGLQAYWLFDVQQCLGRVLLIVGVCQASMYMNELYDYKVAQSRREFSIRLLTALGTACIVLSVIYLLFQGLSIGQTTFIVSLPTLILTIFAWRQLYPRLLRLEPLSERVVILGSTRNAKAIMEEIAEVKDSGLDVLALVTEDDDEEVNVHNPLPVKEVISLQAFPLRVPSMAVDRIVVALGDRRGKLPYQSLLNCRFHGVRVDEAATLYEVLTGKILLDGLRPSWFIFSEGFRQNRLTLRLKRASDLLMATVLLAITAPLMLLSAICIRLDTRGPAIYRQRRVGEGWKEYTLYKFRSMVENAEACGAKWAEEDDPRVTRVGKIIRKYRIDELPQLFNVLKGDMSFVGPRPERRCFVDELSGEIPYYPLRLFVKPGITGWAQIKYKYGASNDDTRKKLQYDLYYIKYMSLLFDLSIMFDTVRVVLTGKGAQ